MRRVMGVMTSRERVLVALHNREPDRVPVNYAANSGLDRRLKARFGLAPDDHEGLLRRLGVDFRGVAAPWRGPKLHADIPERGVKTDHWGIRRCWVEHGSGGYWDYCDFPLREADEETVAGWKLPDPDLFDYSGVAQACRRHAGCAVVAGDAGTGDVINGAGMLRGMEQVLIDLATDAPAGLLLIRRRAVVQLAVLERTLAAARGGFDLFWMGEDLGTQKGPLISLDLYRRHLQPIHRQFIDLAHSHGLPVVIHTCGSSSWAYEEFIAMGIQAVDTLQPEAADMAPEHLKRTFGGRLAFHGCISTAGPVASGTVEETVACCRRTLAIMMPGGGYCFAPTHALQDNSPTENVVAMYETALRDGRYRR